MENGCTIAESGAIALPRRHFADLGWGFVVAWGLIVIFTDSMANGEGANLGVFWLASMIGTPTGLLILAHAKNLLDSKTSNDVLLIGSLTGVMLGTILLASTAMSPNFAGDGIQACGGVVSALGIAAFTIMWGEHYSQLNMQRIERSATYAMILAFGCYALELVLPDILAVSFTLFLPAFSAVCLKIAQDEGLDEDDLDAGHLSKPFSKVPFARECLGITAGTAVISVMWTMVRDGKVSLGHTLFELSVLSGTAVAIFLVFYLSRYSRALNPSALYRWVLPLIAISSALLFIPDEGFALASSSIAFAVMPLINLTTFIYFAELSKVVDVGARWLFGVGRFFVEAGFLAGMLIDPALDLVAAYAGDEKAPIVLLLAFLSTVIMFSFPIKNAREDVKAEGAAHAETAWGEVVSERPLSLEDACSRLASEYGLTKREHEVLTYLAQGYSLPFIRNELCIAQSTIDTHVGHIYKKMDIHSREELITMARGY